MAKPFVHPTAIVEDGAELHDDVKVWHFCHIRKGAILEKGVSIGRDGYVDNQVRIGKHSRIQNGVSLYQGVKISPWCFIGPHVIFTNDHYPRAGNKNWKISDTILKFGVAIGAGSVIRCGIELGSFAMIGAGAIVTKSVPAFHLAMGFPARSDQIVCFCGQTRVGPKGHTIKRVKPEEVFLKCCQENLEAELQQEIIREYSLNLKEAL